MRLTLKDEGYSFKKIMQGRNWIGRVYPKADGTFGAVIGKGKHFDGLTVEDAFKKVAANHFGFESPAHLASHNANVRQHNASIRAAENAALASMIGPELMKVLKSL